MSTQQPKALQRFKIGYPSDSWGERSSTPTGLPDPNGAWVRHEDISESIRSQRARIEELESQLSAIGAGGVEPLRKRECLHQIAEPPSDGWLQDGGLIYRLTDERRPQNRDEINVTMADGSRTDEARARRAGELLDCIRASALASTAAQPPAGWINVEERMPEPGKAVLLLGIGKKTPIRAMWAAKHTIEAHIEAEPDWCDYDEATDTHYCPEGWYEWNEHEEVHWSVDGKPRAWMPLPPAPKE